MNASDRTQIRRNRVLFENRRELAPTKLRAACMDTGFETTLRMQRLTGEIESGPLPPLLPLPADTSARTYKATDAFFAALDALLVAVAAANAGPTRTSRIAYLWFTGVAGACNWVRDAPGRMTGTHDGWSWDIRRPLYDARHTAVLRQIWLIAAIEVLAPSFTPTFDTDPLRTATRTALGISSADYDTLETFVRSTGHFDEWRAAWNA